LVRSPSLSLPIYSFPTPLKAIAKSFFVLFHVSIWSPPTIYLHLNLLHLPSPPQITPPYCTYFTVLFLLIFKLMFKGVSQRILDVSLLYFGPFNPFHCSPLAFYLPPPIFSTASIHNLISSIFTDVMFYDTVDAPSFSFPFHSSLSFIEQFHYYKHVLNMSLYVIMFVFAYIFIFWIYLPPMRENMQPLSFWVWLTSLNMMSSNIFKDWSIYKLFLFLQVSVVHFDQYPHSLSLSLFPLPDCNCF
jgi:hypothetical protein